jgi:hypothetical protein
MSKAACTIQNRNNMLYSKENGNPLYEFILVSNGSIT